MQENSDILDFKIHPKKLTFLEFYFLDQKMDFIICFSKKEKYHKNKNLNFGAKNVKKKNFLIRFIGLKNVK